MRLWQHGLILLISSTSSGATRPRFVCPTLAILGVSCCLDPNLKAADYPQYVYNVTTSFYNAPIAAYARGPSCSAAALYGSTDQVNSAVQDVLFNTCQSQASPEDCQKYATCLGCTWATMVYSFYGDGWNKKEDLFEADFDTYFDLLDSVDLELGYGWNPQAYCRQISSDPSTLFQAGSADFVTQCIGVHDIPHFLGS